MKTLLEAYNTFTKEQYPPNEKNISEVPYEDVQKYLINTFGSSGFSQKVTFVGQAVGNNGPENFVVVEVTLPLENGSSITVPGSAQGKIGIPGLITSAIRNAVLRHAGMGAELYEHVEGYEPQFENNGALPIGAPPNPFANPTVQPFGNPTGQFIPQGNKRSGGFPPWNGEAIIKSGQFAGLKWSQLPPDVIMSMVQKGNNLAQKELARRNGG